MEQRINPIVAKKQKKSRITFKQVLLLQMIVGVYTISGVMAKFASGYEFLSKEFILFYGAEIVILGVYAILWQQIIKKIELSTAYANRSSALIWSMMWAVLFFQETVSLKNMLGVLIVVLGTIIVNTDHE